RAAGPVAGAGAARRTGATQRAHGGHALARPGRPRRPARRRRARALGQGVRPAGGVHAPARPGALALRPARERLGLRRPEPLAPRRRVSAAAASQGGRALRCALARDGAWRRLPAARGRRPVRRVPIRVRVAAAFAVAMAVVLVCTGWFLYARLGSHLSAALD